MTSFITLWNKRLSVVLTEYFIATNAAEDNRSLEYRSSIKIQSAWRGHVVRKDLNGKRRAATAIQRAFRGYRGRLEFDEALRAKFRREREEYFFNAASLVQKMWRGYISRKNVLNYYKRKAYLAEVQGKSDKLRADLQQQAEIQNRIAEEERRRKTEEEFRQKTSSLHYLVSTKAHPGIYSTKREKIAGMLFEGVSLEEHIRQNAMGTIKASSNKWFSSSMRTEMSESYAATAGATTGSTYVTLPPISPPQGSPHHSKKAVSVKQ
eukprot:TRINITY_DN26642_c0_g1_i1.p1 TRINITY_DN26642_c0_g1~~TRINITY_DN26642_c0_g1_i1.p1  ORF type:complete len:265 (+),score=49.71 TRINITY_DN26642_c0_g1_i1:80-874(+)